MISFFLLDGNILQGIKAIGISPSAMQLFHKTVKKQMNMDYQQVDFDSAPAFSFMKDTYQLMKKAHVLKHKKR